jgi:excisionase family DNA binding protein
MEGQPDEHSRIMAPREAAARLGVSRATVYRMIRDGQMPSTTIRGRLRIPAPAFERWLADHSAAALGEKETS